MTDPQPPPGRHLATPAPRAPWDVLADAQATSRAREAGSRAHREPEFDPDPDPDPDPDFAPPPPDRDLGVTRRSRLWSEVFDRLPGAGQRVVVDLGRHWWLPVLAALVALVLTVGVALRARPVAQAAVAPLATAGATVASTPAAGSTQGAVPTPSLSLLATPSAAAVARAASPGAGSTPTPAATVVPSAVSTVVVDVAGRVRHPGVVRLASGSRIVDAIRAAGGSLPHTDLTPLDLAQPLTDGEQVRVGLPGSPVVGATTGGTPPLTDATATPSGDSTTAPAAPIDINTATAVELDALPGIGPVLAGRIVDWRTAHGPFATVDSLEDVPGIGPTSLQRLRALVTVGP